ncbi:ALS_1a_G0044760.mRNA.1.CDS.1 [Saccharomyces cerevisiae]|nr:ALS_1a_G0044760.mRNA.1.CDS.1 [Saccharomyces cerevisiae]CAI6858124.1 ALS_1a_G0044760.mRNA.1.CDS.1 [Saccharomyces cerevisiae]
MLSSSSTVKVHHILLSPVSNPAVVLEKVGDIAIEQRPIPTIKDPHYVKLAIKATGICGSDIHYYRSGGIGKYILKAPMVLGHESSGQVVEVGDAVTRVKVGDRVAIEPGVPSRYSDETKEGRYNLCPHMAFAATPPIDGTLVKYYLSPEDFLVKLPEGVSYEEGACVEPLSVGVHSNKLAGVRFGTKVVVFGAGPVGLFNWRSRPRFWCHRRHFRRCIRQQATKEQKISEPQTLSILPSFPPIKPKTWPMGVQKLFGRKSRRCGV